MVTQDLQNGHPRYPKWSSNRFYHDRTCFDLILGPWITEMVTQDLQNGYPGSPNSKLAIYWNAGIYFTGTLYTFISKGNPTKKKRRDLLPEEGDMFLTK